jgi:hypothetical protein
MRSSLFHWAAAAAAAATALLHATAALAWGAEGHRTVGAIADRLIAASPAAVQVNSLLGGLSLEQAAVWADCAKGVNPAKDFAYTSAGKYPECAVFETPALEAEMIDFVRRNDTNCPRVPGDESCHKQYHYTDEAIQRSRYHLGDRGTRSFDVVAAIAAAMHVLRGDPAPAPFNIKDKREALLLLAHFVGDIHQPLHVGAIYLDVKGLRVDPDVGTFDPSSETQGGNAIVTIQVATNRRSENLHATWDDIPEALDAQHVDSAWLALARKVAPTRGALFDWPAAWASQTLTQARQAFKGLQFGPEQSGQWTVALACSYDRQMTRTKKSQLTLAGARLAQILENLWPGPG